MTKKGRDHLKRQARAIREATGRRRRHPDILAELSRNPRTPMRPSTELVLLCSGLAHPIDGGRCARPAGHHLLDGTWSWCSPKSDLPAHIWQSYHDAADEAHRAQHDAWLASMSPSERAEWEAEQWAEYWADMAAEAREPYDPYDDKHHEFVLDALDEEIRDAEPDDFGEYDDEEMWDGAYR
ncbi:hypothetical protein DMH26_28590 [Streptomyces sp. WAC 05379]|uniref:hypothetical protein n=1 Tax=Streptomyces sp. WAC 05379 TaxID=2203207 RepID=UPI000F74BBC4|nr:hypothetical protein [Streptomyces sp. WAC 05379]RSN90117.1 hypothetical protein DMH26_28590 [Streptomyces sp. WAC 05379]